MTFNSGETLRHRRSRRSRRDPGRGILRAARARSGQLVEVLAGYKVDAYDISVVFQKEKRAAPRLRVFVDFLVKLFNPAPWSVRRRG